MTEPPIWLSEDQAAKYLLLSIWQMRQLRKQRRIAYYPFARNSYRYKQADLDAYAETVRVEAGQAAPAFAAPVEQPRTAPARKIVPYKRPS